MTEKTSERQDRIAKLNELKSQGIDPYPARVYRDHEIIQVIEAFEKLEQDKAELKLVGRLRSMRTHGNLTFANLEDGSGKIQIAFSKAEVGQDSYKLLVKTIDIGDFVEITGKAFVTHKGEQSVMVSEWRVISKALRPLPDKYHGLQDEEARLRKRYLDILFNPELKEMVRKRAIFWQSIREFLITRGFQEVETPVLENTTGGADARPFVTHHNALDIDVYLRISMGELWQKRLMVAGFEKTFEIGRQFRNEGMDAEHLQDYTQMEFYWSYANYEDGMALVEDLFKYVAEKTFGTLKFTIGKFEVDLGKKWERYDYRETVLKFTGVDVLNVTLEEAEKKLQELGVDYDRKGFNITRAIDNLWKYCRKQIGGPGFLVGVPVEVSPLAKRDDSNREIAQKFHPLIAGSELGNGYSELNDPIDQAERFMRQTELREAGDEEAQMNDADFVEALEYGMPPTCGFGLSERVFSFLMNKTARECQIFPLMRPKSQNEE
ncbi:lysine--tRNA ligase [Candidatus Falkowbacteria bacterium]|nr:lysine--tRNA ligase [Candidatus Falkowbacteria bacterium]